MIKLKKIGKMYDETILFENINFKFINEKTYCIMGESGAGKTTLLNLIMGIEKPTFGEVIREGRISAAFQDDRLIEDMDAVENIRYVSPKLDEDTIKNELRCILPPESVSKRISELSGGMKKRVAIVRAMTAESDVVLLDEPFSGLDMENKKMAAEYIKNRKKQRIIITVTHSADEAQMLNSDICVLTINGLLATITVND